MKLRASFLVATLAIGVACHRSSPPEAHDLPPATSSGSGSGSASADDVLDSAGLAVTTSGEANERVGKAFPHGVATENARAEIGTAPPRPPNMTPNPASAWVADLVLPAPMTAEKIRAAYPPPPTNRTEHVVRGRTGAGVWQYIEANGEKGPFERVAILVDLVADKEPVPAADLKREDAWARGLATKLGAAVPTFSMTSTAATEKARSAVALRKQLSDDDLEIGVTLVAPPGKKFRGRLVWDVVYSAGFEWGDGDYFHWRPSPTTDDSQGIGIETSTGAGYFLPESVAANDGSADVNDLTLSFSVAKSWQPTKVFDVMVHAASYMSRRLGGTLVSKGGSPFDPKAARERVVKIEEAMLKGGLAPGSDLALTVF